MEKFATVVCSDNREEFEKELNEVLLKLGVAGYNIQVHYQSSPNHFSALIIY